MPAYRYTIQLNNDSSTIESFYNFDIYNKVSNPAVTATMIPQVQRFLDFVSLSSTVVSSVSSALNSLGA